MPKNAKTFPILRLAPPTNKQDLRKFFSFVNYYNKLWNCPSHILSISTYVHHFQKVQMDLGSEQQDAFDNIKLVMWCRVLLHYPNFNMPFDVYPGASTSN